MFGYVHGMGMSLIMFDWAQVSVRGFVLLSHVFEPWFIFRLHILGLRFPHHGELKLTSLPDSWHLSVHIVRSPFYFHTLMVSIFRDPHSSTLCIDSSLLLLVHDLMHMS